MVLAGWWGDKFNRLFLNPVAMPKLKSVEVTVDLLPERRIATIDNAWTPIDRSRSGHRDSGESFPAPLSRRAHRTRRAREDSRRHAATASIGFCSATPIP